MPKEPINNEKFIEEKEEVVIRFCGDSGDGMQLTGSRFTDTAAAVGNDLSTLPDYPAEIRAPAGSLAGVSGFQVNFSSKEIRTPGDAPDVLVAMNPAALKTNIKDLKTGGMLVINIDAFTEENLKLAAYEASPLEDDSLSDYALYKIPITNLTYEALKETGLPKKDIERCKNFFALGLMYWLYERPLDITEKWIESKFKSKPNIAEANKKALKTGYYFGETAELFKKTYRIPKAKLDKGTYRNITGNEATALGFIAASQLSATQLIYSSYPITPASDVLHELSKHKNFGVKTCQAEDEIAAMGMAIGVAYAGSIAVTGTSGPGLALKSEALSLALMMELPLVVVNVQRGGPSTGLPTKTEQSDLFQALYGRHGESPIPVIAPSSPGDCFTMALEAVRISTKYMTPVLYLSDGYLANGAEPWKLPDIDKLDKIKIDYASDPETYQPYKRDVETLSRPWAIPGTPGLEHRLGGLEKAENTGNVSYDPNNHERMCQIRAEKIARVADMIPDIKVFGEDKGDILIVGWGGTEGAITSATEALQKKGVSISSIHLRYLNPFPKNLEKILQSFKHIIVAELNLGQLVQVLNGKFNIKAKSINKIQGKPFKITEILQGIHQVLLEEGGEKSWPQKAQALLN